MTIRTQQRIVSALAAFPVLWLALLYLLVIRARLQFGHWPSDSDGMAKYSVFSGHRDLIVDAFMYGVPLAVIAALTWAILLRRGSADFPIWKPLVVLALSMGVSTLLMAIDPGGFIIWVVD